MRHEIFVILALAATVTAGRYPFTPGYSSSYYQPEYTIQNTGPAYAKPVAASAFKHIEYEAPPLYEFSYSVNDPTTGDVKEQAESRDGDVVHGYYTLIDPDGYKRIVEYTADDQNGFRATVRREPIGVYPPSVPKVLTPSNTAYKKIFAPVGQYSPTTYVDPAAKFIGSPDYRGRHHSAPVNYYQH